MAFIAFLLLAAGIADLVRGTPDPVSPGRAFGAAVCGSIAVALLAALGGFSPAETGILAAALIVLLTLWGIASDDGDSSHGRVILSLVVLVFLSTLAVSASAPDLGADLQRWYEQLPVSPEERPSLTQFVMGLAVGVFVIASANRVVRIMLRAAHAQIVKGRRR
jgi:hypothetical protein